MLLPSFMRSLKTNKRKSASVNSKYSCFFSSIFIKMDYIILIMPDDIGTFFPFNLCIFTTVKFGVGKIFKRFLKNSLMLTKAEFI